MSTPILANLRSRLLASNGKCLADLQKRCLSYDEINRRRNEIFDNEQRRQRENIGRIEKIEVRYLGMPQDETLVMNKNLSTPFNCAQHLNETICNNSVLALVNSNILWDMHRPLEDSCTLQLLNFKILDPTSVNAAFWRSCSFVLGAVLQNIFKDDAQLFLHSFPRPSIKSGSFIHDFGLAAKNWTPSLLELKSVAIEMRKFASENHKFERLKVSHDVALEMFKDNPFKREQLPSISNQNNGSVMLYRAGEHIDISRGPMIANTGFIHKTRIAAVHKVSKEDDTCNLYRIQGIALPTGFRISYYAFNVLGERAKKLNSARLPHEVDSDSDQAEAHIETPELQKYQNVN